MEKLQPQRLRACLQKNAFWFSGLPTLCLLLLIGWNSEEYLTSFEVVWALVGKSCELWSMAMIMFPRGMILEERHEGYICQFLQFRMGSTSSHHDERPENLTDGADRRAVFWYFPAWTMRRWDFVSSFSKFDDFTCTHTGGRIGMARLSTLLSIVPVLSMST